MFLIVSVCPEANDKERKNSTLSRQAKRESIINSVEKIGNPGGGSTNDDSSLFRDFNTPNQQTSSDTHASRVSLILVTRDLLDKPTGGVTNTMDKASLGTLLTDDPGGGDLNAGLWWTDADYAIRSYVHDCGG